jgi:hypothetical protein
MKIYTDKEIDDLVKEVRDEILGPIFKEAQEQLAKSEHVAQAAKEGGNGTQPVVASMAKEEGSMSESSSEVKKEESSMAKDEFSPAGKEASDEKSPSPAVPEGSSESSSSSSSDGAPKAPDAAPQEDPAMEDAHVDSAQLAEAYGALDDDALQAHFEALKQVLTQRMGAGQDPAAGPPDQGMAPPDMGAAPGVPPPPAPAEKAMPVMAPAAVKPPQAMMRSEAPTKEEALNKAEVETLKSQVAGLTQVLETLLLKPQRKAVTSMAEFVAKSEADVPKKTLSKSEIRQKLEAASKDEKLAKSDKELICRYFLNNDVKVSELTHLLK